MDADVKMCCYLVGMVSLPRVCDEDLCLVYSMNHDYDYFLRGR